MSVSIVRSLPRRLTLGSFRLGRSGVMPSALMTGILTSPTDRFLKAIRKGFARLQETTSHRRGSRFYEKPGSFLHVQIVKVAARFVVAVAGLMRVSHVFEPFWEGDRSVIDPSTRHDTGNKVDAFPNPMVSPHQSELRS